MQGEQAENSIIASLDKIYENADLFDVVVIIRGGGASTDLNCFDSYNLALNCAQFPLPVITGIGHQRDTTVLDLVANTSVKTPTAVAALLTEKMQETESKVLSVAENIFSLINEKIATENRKIDNFKWQMKSLLSSKINRKHVMLQKQVGTLKMLTKSIIQHRQNWLNLIEKSIESHSPAFLLKHGYSISTFAGKRITSVKQVTKGNIIRTYVHDGDFESEVIK
jgi:exodeoxyribonuclease VII large subunit